MLPESTTADGRRLLVTRALRGFADGVVSVLLADYLSRLGFSPFEVGALVTGTLVGSAVLTVWVGLAGHRWPLRTLLLAAACLMLATGLGFLGFRTFWPLFVVAVVGTLNPSSGDVSVFLPTEQAALSRTSSAADRVHLFAWYNVLGTFAGALGALASGFPGFLVHQAGVDFVTAERGAFALYAAIALAAVPLYGKLSPQIEPEHGKRAPLARSRGIVIRLAALFSLDAFGGGFVVQALLVFWLYRRFQLSPELTGAIFFAFGLLGALSQFLSAKLAGRIGLIQTMVFTHLPANVFLVVAGVVPSAGAAIALLLLRAALSSMDVPARQAYVMGVVPPEERAAASSITNVPRSLASALPPLLTGALLARSNFGWPLVIAGLCKATYDLLLLAQFRAVPPLDEA